MNLVRRKNGGMPSLVSDLFGKSPLMESGLFDIDWGMWPSRLGINVPTANLTESAKEFKVELAAPGLEGKDFNVEIDNHMLTISAEKEEEKKMKEGEYSKREYAFNSFSRSFSLPENVKEENIDAKYENGVLTISIPKMKETPVKPAVKVTVK